MSTESIVVLLFVSWLVVLGVGVYFSKKKQNRLIRKINEIIAVNEAIIKENDRKIEELRSKVIRVDGSDYSYLLFNDKLKEK